MCILGVCSWPLTLCPSWGFWSTVDSKLSNFQVPLLLLFQYYRLLFFRTKSSSDFQDFPAAAVLYQKHPDKPKAIETGIKTFVCFKKKRQLFKFLECANIRELCLFHKNWSRHLMRLYLFLYPWRNCLKMTNIYVSILFQWLDNAQFLYKIIVTAWVWIILHSHYTHYVLRATLKSNDF